MYMGLIGMIITIVIMVLGAGYYFFGMSQSQSSITINNKQTTINSQQTTDNDQQSTNNQSPIDSARDVKNLVEQKSAEVSQQLTDNNEQQTINSQQMMGGDKQVTDNLPTRQTGSKQPTGELKIEDRLMSTGFSSSTKVRSIDTIVIHSSYDLNGSDPYSASGIIKEYTDYGVSAHYLIDRKGVIYRLVEDKNIAYHAGVSKMPDGRKNANDFSIGIEMMNTEKGQFTSAQYTAVDDLIASLKKQYKIKFVVGHNDIAPDRKTDPWNFDWKKVN